MLSFRLMQGSHLSHYSTKEETMQTVGGMLKEYPQIQRLVLAAAPSYRKHKFSASACDSITLTDTYWSGGTRSTYVAVHIDTLKTGPAPQYDPPGFGGPRVAPHCDIPEGFAIVETGIFCGKPATAHVTLTPADFVRLFGNILPS
jgi:hypothetical protein